MSNGQPFARNKQATILKREHNFTADLTGDRVGFSDEPSQMAVTNFQNQRSAQRAEGERNNSFNQMLFTGMGGFSMQKQMADQFNQKRSNRIEANT